MPTYPLPTRRRVWFIVILVTLIALVLTAGGPSRATDASAGRSGRAVAPTAKLTIRFRVLNATDLPLTVSDKKIFWGSWRSEPNGAKHLQTDDYTLLGSDWWFEAMATVYYRIGATDHYVRVDARNPVGSPNQAACSIVNAEYRADDSSPYRCDWKVHPGDDFDADFVVEPRSEATHIVSDDDRYTRRYVMDELCDGAGNTFESCDAEVSNTVEDHAPGTVVGSVLVNCSSRDAVNTIR